MNRGSWVCRLLALAAAVLSATESAGFAQAAAAAQTTAASPAETGLPLKPARRIAFSTDEGTWLSLDVSADGGRILFDLLGDLYTLPIEGGKATRLTHGMAYDATPQYSPDGTSIAFVSDRSGLSQLWVMKADGSAPRQITRGAPIVGAPVWTPDGRALMAVTSTSREGAGYGELWKYDVASGKGTPLLPDSLPATEPRSYPNLSPPTIHPDNRKLWFSNRSSTLRDGRALALLREFDLGSRAVTVVAVPDSNASRPVVSPDGKWLAYFAEQTAPARTVLRLRSISHGSSGTDRLLAAVEPQDQWLASYPGYAFTPDGKAVILASGGKLTRVSVEDGRVTRIPFTAPVELELGERVHATGKLQDGPLMARKLTGVTRSPDGQKLAFGAVGKVWTATGRGRPTRLTMDSTAREFDPVFSPDGRWIAFASWSNENGGRLWKVAATGGRPVALTTDSAGSTYYAAPRWSPDGAQVWYVAVPNFRVEGQADFGGIRLSWVPAAGGPGRAVGPFPWIYQYDRMTFDFVMQGTPHRAYYIHRDSDRHVLKSVGLDGAAERIELVIDASNTGIDMVRAVPSPDGRWLAMLNDLEVVALRWPECAGSESCVVRLEDAALVPVSRNGGIQPFWSADGRWLSWVRGNTVFKTAIAELVARPRQSRIDSVTVDLKAPGMAGSGTVVFKGARLITMEPRGVTRTPTADGGVRVTTDPVVIERGDILVRDRRIVALGHSGTVAVPAGAKVIDASGKTIMPGLIDLHADGLGLGSRFANALPWDLPGNLAYGVTTARSPGNSHYDTDELVESGVLLGPRVFSILHINGRVVTTLAQARAVMRAHRELGAGVIKAGTSQASRLGQQLTIMAARLEGINITNHWYEGSVQDGNSGVEHSRFSDQGHRMYRDWVELTARAGTTWTPTLVVAMRHHRPWEEQHTLYERFERCADLTSVKLRRFVAPRFIDKDESGRARLPCDRAFGLGIAMNAARSAREVLRAGGRVAASSHGNSFEGVMMIHWELETMVQGGMTPAEALSTATLHGAHGLGLEAELGSLQAGKVADLLVLDRNPLEDIRHTLTIRSVMKDGVLYDGDTLNELWPGSRRFAGNPWQVPKSQASRPNAGPPSSR